MDEREFQLKAEEVEILCSFGGAAPSGGNVQAWKVRIIGNVMELKLDLTRTSSFLDFNRLASLFSLGSFAENVSIASNYLGLKYSLQIMDYQNTDDVVAKFIYTGRNNHQINDVVLYNSILNRCTNRKLYDGTTIDHSDIVYLSNSVSEYNSSYKFTTVSLHSDKIKIAETLGKADSIRNRHDELSEQMFNEIRWTQAEAEITRDGIDVATMEAPPNVIKMMALLKRYPFLRKMLPDKAFVSMVRPLILGCSHFCCLSTTEKVSSQMMFIAGQVLERLWLESTHKLLSVHPWTVLPFFMIRVEKFSSVGFTHEDAKTIKLLGTELREVFGISGDETPLFIFRLSRSPNPTKRALRIPWREFTTIF
jgi:hypothetical protein